MGDKSQKDKDKGQKQRAIKDADTKRQKREKQAKTPGHPALTQNTARKFSTGRPARGNANGL